MFGANAFGWVYPAQPFLQLGLPIAGGVDIGTITESASVKVTALVTSDVNGSLTESAVGTSQLANTDTNGTVTETVATLVRQTSDTNGAVTESASPKVTQLTSTDVNSGVVESAGSNAAITAYEPGVIATYNDFPKFFNTYSQIPVAYPTYNSIATGPPPLPQLTETVVVQFVLYGIDANGTVTESTTITKAALNDTDSSTVSETASTRFITTVTDANGSVTEGASAGTAFATTDVNGAASEATSSIAKYTVTDVGTANEVATITVKNLIVTDSTYIVSEIESTSTQYLVSASDTNGAVTESTLIAIPIGSSDVNGATTETQALVVKLTPTDTNSTVVENQNVLTQQFITVIDSGGALESTAAQAKVGSADATVGFDGAFESTNPIVVEIGHSSETASVPVATIGDVDTTVGSDVVALAAANMVSDVGTMASQWEMASNSASTMTTVDAGTDIEAQSCAGFLVGGDVNGGIVENQVINGAPVIASDVNGSTVEASLMAYTLSDSGAIDEITGVVAGVASTDLGAATDIASLQRLLPVTTDVNGATIETATVAKAGLLVSDVGRTSESTTLRALVYSTDIGHGDDTASFIWKQIIPWKPGRIMKRTRGEVFKPTPGETEIPGEWVGRIVKTSVGSVNKRTRGTVTKLTTGRTQK